MQLSRAAAAAMAMLCCVSRKAAAASPGADDVVDSGLFFSPHRGRAQDDALKKLDEAVLSVNAVASTFTTFGAQRRLEFLDAQPVEPQPVEPCGVCGRKFNLSSLSKHERICERTAAKRRKPFDSAKQRIQGTELAEFLPKLRGQTDSSSLGHLGTTSGSLQHSHHHHRHEHHQHSLGRRSSSTGGVSGHRGSSDQGQRTGDAWKQTHDEFLQAIRAARGDNSTVQHQPTSHQQNGAMSNGHHQQPHQPQSSHNGQQHQRPTTLSLQVQTQGVPTRPNEKGQCPTCHRLFGVKSYERHVAFCKERSTRVPASPLLGNNLVAKERLDARMKYRAPGLKNRRPTNREKYSPGNNTLTKTRTLTKEPSGTSSAPDSTARVDNSPKLPILKRQIHSSKESLVGGATNPGPLKSRPMDRSNSGLGQEYDPFLLAEQQLNDLFSDTSDQSSTDGSSTCPPSKTPNSPTLPQSPSSAFAKYPMTSSPPSSTASSLAPAPQRTSVIDPPRGFDDLTSSDLSSECNSGSREVTPPERHVLGRRLIIDQSQALGGLGEFAPVVSRSNSVRSAPKPPERKTPFILHNNNNNNSNNNNNKFSSNNNVSFKNSLNGSMSSLSSDAATDAMMKRSNSLFDELLSSFEEDCTSSSTLPSLMSLMRNDPSVSLLSSSHNNGHIQNNGRPKNRVQCSDDDADLSSPESLKGKECAPKLSADSAYSSLNRKYSAHGRSANDAAKLKLSRFCHECGFKFPDSAKFCCECGVKRLTI